MRELLRFGALLIVLVAIFRPIERLWSLHPQKLFRKAFGTDLVYYFLSSFLPKLLMIIPLTLIASAVHHALHNGFYREYYAAILHMPSSVRFLAALLVSEIGAYWGHRWSHELPFLWRFHALHHSAEELDWLINTHGHPVDMAFTRICGLLPMYLLGLAQPGNLSNGMDLTPVLVSLTGTFWGFFIHANLRWRFGGLEWLVTTPAFHHWHHANDGQEHLNKNYTALLPIVDKCFGTFYLPEEWPQKYGTDTQMAPGLVRQLLQPLMPYHAAAGESGWEREETIQAPAATSFGSND